MRSAPKDIPTPETLFKPKRAVRLSYLPPPHILPSDTSSQTTSKIVPV